MAERPIRVLLVDDDEDDYALARDLLAEADREHYALSWEPDFDRALSALCGSGYDVCLLDYRLGKHSGLDLLRRAVAGGAKAPFLILTGQGQRELDLEAMRAGAVDYLEKGQ